METYTVQSGDTLSALATALLGDGYTYQDLMQYNPQISDPNMISVGDVINYPDDPTVPPVSTTDPAALDTSTVTVPVATAPAAATNTKLIYGVALALLAGAFFFLPKGKKAKAS